MYGGFYNIIKLKKLWTVNPVNRKIATLMLMLGMFFNPMGFDILFYTTFQLTGSYGITTFIFYLLSAASFGLYFYFTKLNPFKTLKDKFKKTSH